MRSTRRAQNRMRSAKSCPKNGIILIITVIYKKYKHLLCTRPNALYPNSTNFLHSIFLDTYFDSERVMVISEKRDR